MWLIYIKIAFRILFRNRRFSLINLAGLTIGLASFIIILSWVRDEVSFDSFHQKKSRIVQLAVKHPNGILDANTPFALPHGMANIFPEIESYSVFMRMESRKTCSFIFKPDTPDRLKAYEPAVVRVDKGFFGIFDFPLLFGSNEDLLTEPDAVVISSRIAEIYYPDINPVGQSILLNNDLLLSISGVADIPENTFARYDFFLPINEDLSEDWNWSDPSFLLMKAGTDMEGFNQKIVSYMNDHFPYPLTETFIVETVPIHKTHLAFGGKWRVFLFSSIAILLILVASLNYMNLASANYTRRFREMGIRKVMGAKRSQLVVSLLLETFLLALGALVLSLFLVELMLPAMTTLFGRQIEIGYLDHPAIMLVLLLIVGLISVLASIYPAVFFTKGNPVDVLHRSIHPKSNRSVLILITIIIQFTLSIALMISTLVVIHQVRYAARADLGFSVDNVVSIPMNQGIGENFSGFLERLESHPDIALVSAGQAPPFHEDFKTNLDWENREDDRLGLFRYSICLNDYPDIFNMEVVKGRMFSEIFGADVDKFMINETAAGILGFDDPLGHSLEMWGLKGEIIGIVKDFHHVSLHREILPHVFNIHPSNYQNLKFVFVKLGPHNQEEALEYIESVCEEVAGDYPFSYIFLEEGMGELYNSDKNLSRILGLFALLTLVVSSLGIYGLAFYSVEKKSKEINIRKVYGAGIWNILVLIYKSLMSRIGISLFLAVGLSLFVMTRWLQNFAYRITLDFMEFLIPALLAFLVAGLATIIAMWRSVRQNPADELKQE